MDILQSSFVFDGCIFAEGDFKGCARDVAESGLNAFFLTIPHSTEGFREAARAIGGIHQMADEPDSGLRVIRSPEDLQRADEEQETGLVLWFQDPHPIENSLELLRVFYELGVRAIQLTYNRANYLGSGCTERIDRGLTAFGAKVVREMNRLGVVIDLSHSSRQTALDAMRESTQPVLFSHANPRAITDSPRNKDDDQLKLLAEVGGVIGLTPWGPLCWRGTGRPSLDDYIDHIEYVVDLIGIDHVGFGSDNTADHSSDAAGTEEQAALYPAVVAEYNRTVGTQPSARHAEGFSGPHNLDNLVDGLIGRGFGTADTAKLLGGNFLRVFKKVWM
ncbi:MAG: membrane dipeptidase [Bacillota bacterium]